MSLNKSTMIALGVLFILVTVGVAYYLKQDSEGFSDYDMDDEDMSLDDHSTSENMTDVNSNTTENYQNNDNSSNTEETFMDNGNREGFQATDPTTNQNSSTGQAAPETGNGLNASDLLPYANDDEHAQLVPNGQGSIWDGANLNAGHHLGVDTVGSSLRNPNLQLRSEPPNPRVKVSPWNQSTIGTDLSHRNFEIGN